MSGQVIKKRPKRQSVGFKMLLRYSPVRAVVFQNRNFFAGFIAAETAMTSVRAIREISRAIFTLGIQGFAADLFSRMTS